MRVCAVAALFWSAAAERDDEMVMLQRKQTSSSLITGFRGSSQWSLCNTKVTSNLGGFAGDSVDEDGNSIATPEAKELRYHKVGQIGGQTVDLRLVTLGAYEPYAPAANGRDGCFGQVNVAAGQKAHVQFSLVATGTDEPISGLSGLGMKQNFTVVDFDRSKERTKKPTKGLTVEQVWAKDFANTGDTRLDGQGPNADGWTVFEAPNTSIETPNPDDGMDLDNLDEDMLDSTVSLTYVDTSVWEVVFRSDLRSGTGTGRNFLWAGATSSCAVEPVCMCTPDEMRRNPGKLEHYMKWTMCDDDSAPVAGNGHVLRYPNVGKMSAGDGTMKVGEKSVDLIVDNVTAYAVNNPAKNGRNGCLGMLNLAAPGEVEMKFTLVESGTDTPVPVDAEYPLTYDFNIFDFDQSASGKMQEVIGVSAYSRLVARFPGIQKEEDGATTWLRSTTNGVPEPTSDIRKDLTNDQLLSSFSVSYRGVSSWVVKFKAEAKQNEPRAARPGGRNFLFSGESCASWRFHECSCPTDQKVWRNRRARKHPLPPAEAPPAEAPPPPPFAA